MGTKYLTDTNTIIDFAANRLPSTGKAFLSQVIDDMPYLSIINKIELLGFSTVSNEVVEFVENAVVISLNDSVAQRTIMLRKRYKNLSSIII